MDPTSNSLADPSKVQKYETFINEKLKTSIQKLTIIQRDISFEITEYSNLIKSIKLVNASTSSKIKSKVDLGFHFYISAESDNDDKFFVYLGHDLYAEMNGVQAEKFILKKIELLESKLKNVNQEIANFQGQVRFVMEGIRELNEKKS